MCIDYTILYKRSETIRAVIHCINDLVNPRNSFFVLDLSGVFLVIMHSLSFFSLAEDVRVSSSDVDFNKRVLSAKLSKRSCRSLCRDSSVVAVNWSPSGNFTSALALGKWYLVMRTFERSSDHWFISDLMPAIFSFNSLTFSSFCIFFSFGIVVSLIGLCFTFNWLEETDDEE